MATFLSIVGFLVCVTLIAYLINDMFFKNTSSGCGGTCSQGRKTCDCKHKHE